MRNATHLLSEPRLPCGLKCRTAAAGPAGRPFGKGLANMRQRVTQRGGQRRFEVAGGTRVILRVPLGAETGEVRIKPGLRVI